MRHLCLRKTRRLHTAGGLSGATLAPETNPSPGAWSREHYIQDTMENTAGGAGGALAAAPGDHLQRQARVSLLPLRWLAPQPPILARAIPGPPVVRAPPEKERIGWNRICRFVLFPNHFGRPQVKLPDTSSSAASVSLKISSLPLQISPLQNYTVGIARHLPESAFTLASLLHSPESDPHPEHRFCQQSENDSRN